MKLRLVEYKEGVITEVHNDLDPKQMDVEFVDLRYTAPLYLEGTVEKGLDTLTFRGHLTSDQEHLCGRCLKSIVTPLDKPFEFFYETKGKEIIETLDDLRETLILDHPLSFVCSEGCKGLCPSCGANLNETRCRCETQVPAPPPASPFSELQKMWKTRKEENRRGQS